MRFRFTGEGRVVHPHSADLGEPRIGGDLFAFLQHEHIAGYEFAAGDLLLLAVANHPGFGGQHAAQGLNGPPARYSWKKAKMALMRITPRMAQPRVAMPSRREGVGKKGEAGGHPQQQGEEMRELARKPAG